MIQEFSLQNYRSFAGKQTLSLLATPDRTLADELIVEPKPGVRLLRMGMIYGANASGKSNLLLAIQTLWSLLFVPREKEHEKTGVYTPFALSVGEPTCFDILFWVGARRYQYRVEYNDDAILYERMMYATDKDVLSLMYERRQGAPILFGTTLGIKAKQRDELNRDTLGNHTVLSTLNKRNIDVPPVMRELYEWVKANAIHPAERNNVLQIAAQAERIPALKQLILEMLNKADFNISDFSLIEILLPPDFVEEANNDYLLREAAQHYLRTKKQLLLTHRTEEGDFTVAFGLESAGTKAYFRLARLLYDLRGDGNVLLEDELEDSLHYDLVVHYLQTYLQNAGRSQLLFATHNQHLLDEDWMIRRDMVWLTEKDRRRSASTLYRASDMGLHKNVSLMNAYRIGKLGAKPLLGSTLLDTDER